MQIPNTLGPVHGLILDAVVFQQVIVQLVYGDLLESPEVTLAKLRERLRNMSDEELVKFGEQVRALSGPRVSPVPDPWEERLRMTLEEWRRRHPQK